MKTSLSGRLRPTLLAAAGITAALASLPAGAQETPPAPPTAPAAAAAPATATAKVDPEARALLDLMAKSHQALTAFSATMDFSVLQNDMTTKQQAKITFQKPNKARISTNNPTNGAAIAAVSDGTFVFHTDSSEKDSYHKSVAAPDIKAIAQVFKDSEATGIGFFPMLTTQADISNDILPPGVTSLVHSPDETVGGVLCDVVSARHRKSRSAWCSLWAKLTIYCAG